MCTNIITSNFSDDLYRFAYRKRILNATILIGNTVPIACDWCLRGVRKCFHGKAPVLFTKVNDNSRTLNSRLFI